MTPQEAEQIMIPFYPHDPNLAMKAMSKALDGVVPAWILQSIVQAYFSFLEIRNLQERIAQTVLNNKDPFGLNTVPYMLNSDIGMGLN